MDNPLFTSQDSLAAIRIILLAEMQERVQKLEERIDLLQQQGQAQTQEQAAQWAAIQAELAELQHLARVNQQYSQSLQADLLDLDQRALTDPEKITTRLIPMMTNLIRRTIRESPDEMAEAIGPVMGEAVRVQIRDSRQGMVDALYPIIGQTVQRAIAEFARELQHNIDTRLKSTFGPEGLLRTLGARLRGISPAELALRDAMPYEVGEVFIIQHDSGMLMAHRSPGSTESSDSDLVSSMLTAIRSFVKDSFGQDEEKELDEIQYGDERIIIQSGRYAYVAVVIQGIESAGFRAMLHDFVSELHVRYSNALRDFDGDPADLPNLQTPIAELLARVGGKGAARSQEASPQRRGLLIGGTVILLVFLATACFYLYFTARLWPVVFPGASATPTNTATASATATATATSTLTSTPVITLSPTPTASLTPSPTLTLTPTQPATLTPTPYFVQGYVIGDVWSRAAPNELAERKAVIYANTPVKVLAVYGYWVQVEWINVDGPQQAWLLLRWVVALDAIPSYLITPTPSQ